MSKIALAENSEGHYRGILKKILGVFHKLMVTLGMLKNILLVMSKGILGEISAAFLEKMNFSWTIPENPF